MGKNIMSMIDSCITSYTKNPRHRKFFFAFYN
jgi:hypothetical protein